MMRVRSLFLSDLHLGHPDCQADALLQCLIQIEADTIYLVGDIIDSWRLSEVWPESHHDITVTMYHRASQTETNIIYIPGNHDAFMRGYVGDKLFHFQIEESVLHHSADGKQYLVIHGDQVDHLLWLSFFWSTLWPKWARHIYHFFHTSKNIEHALLKLAKRTAIDGVICGHTHVPKDYLTHDGVRYLNCGSWIQQCSAVIEHLDGRMELVKW